MLPLHHRGPSDLIYFFIWSFTSVWRVYCADVFSTSPDILRKSVHYDGFSTLYVDIFSVEVLSTDQAWIYI